MNIRAKVLRDRLPQLRRPGKNPIRARQRVRQPHSHVADDQLQRGEPVERELANRK
jgi:hypothetical protein